MMQTSVFEVHISHLVGHMEKQEMEMKWKLEMETGNGNWKLKTEMEIQPVSCCSHSNVVAVFRS